MTNKTEGIIMYHSPPGSYRLRNELCGVAGDTFGPLSAHGGMASSVIPPVSGVAGMSDRVAAVNQCTSGNFCTSRAGAGCFKAVIEYFKVPLGCAARSVSETSSSRSR